MAEQNIIGGNHIAAGQRDRGIGVLQENPPVSGNAYQNATTNSVIIYLPSYATTSGTAGQIQVYIGPSAPPTYQIINQRIGPSTGAGLNDTVHFHVPIEWWWSITLTNATLQSGVVIID